MDTPTFYSNREPDPKLTSKATEWLASGNTMLTRLNIIQDPRVVFAIYVQGTVQIAPVNTTLLTASGQMVYSVLGTHINSRQVAMMTAEIFTSDVFSLVPQPDAVTLDLPRSTITVEDVTQADNTQGGFDVLHWEVAAGDAVPVACRVPLAIPLPPNVDVPHGLAISDPIPEELATYLPLKSWWNAWQWIYKHNESHSLHFDGILGQNKFDGDGVMPNSTLQLPDSWANWNPTTVYTGPNFDTVVALAESRAQAITNASKTTGAAPNVPTDATSLVRATIEGFKEIQSTTVTTAADSESARNALHAQTKWRILLGRNLTVGGATNGHPATLSDSFVAVLSAKTNTTSMHLFQEDITAMLQNKRQLHSRDVIWHNANLRGEQFDRSAIALLKQPVFAGSNTKTIPAKLNSGISLFNYLGPSTDSDEWNARISESIALTAEENLDTHESKRRKPNLVPYLRGKQHTKNDLLSMLANVLLFIEWAVTDVQACALYQYLTELFDFFSSPTKDEWWLVVRKHRPVVHNIIMAIQRVFFSFAELTIDNDTRLHVTAGNPLPEVVYETAHLTYRNVLSKFRETLEIGENEGSLGDSSASYEFFFPPNKDNKNKGDANKSANGNGAGNGIGKSKANTDSATKANTPKADTPGFLTYNGKGRVAHCTINFGTAEKPKNLCANTAIKGRTCKFGASCKNAHFASLNEIPPQHHAAIKEYVTKADGVNWTPGHGPNTTTGTT